MKDNDDYSSIINQRHFDRINSLIEDAREKGADINQINPSNEDFSQQQFFKIPPTIVTNTSDDMKIMNEEIFGPVLSMMKTETYEEALNLVNDHELGNGAAVSTKSGNIAKHFTENAKIGMIGVNVPIPVPVAYHSFGGWKRSLFGDHSIHGPDGVRFYTKLKTTTVTWSDDDAGPEFTIPVLS